MNARKLFRPTEYFKPKSVMEAINLLTKYGDKARLIAGGTDILVEKNPEIEVLIDVMGLGLDYIKSDSHQVRMGSTTAFANIETSSVLDKSPYNILTEAAHQMGTPQVRNVATIGGNICSAVPSADSAPPLLALDATVIISGPAGERSLDIANFFLDVRKNALESCELLTEIHLRAFSLRTEAVFMKKGRVAAADLAVVNTAVRLTMTTEGICQEVRIAIGAAAPTPIRAKEAEAMLQGRKPQDKLLEKVAAQASQEIKPISDVRSSAEYRTRLSRILVERALKEVAGRLLA